MSRSTLKSASVAILSFAGIATGCAQSAVPPPAKSTVHSAVGYGKIPLSFEHNRGQADPSVQFLARGSYYTVLLQPQAATLVLTREDPKPIESRAGRHLGNAVPSTRAAVRMTLEGASLDAAMSAGRQLPGYVNYIMGGDRSKWQVGLPTYAATRVTQAYPGIDLVYYGTDRQLEYDFIVAPEADPGVVHLGISGANPVLEPGGELRLQIASASRDHDVLVHKPVVYQQIDGRRHSVDGAFTVAANGQVGFRIGAYDHDKELVIDPVIGYGSYYGGNGEDEINGSALNASNQLYAVGQTLSAVLPSASGEFQASGGGGVGGHDAFVTKFSADGSTVLWTTFLQGSGDDFATGVAVNSSDQAYVVGYTYSCLNPGEFNNTPSTAVRFPFTSDAIQPLCNAGYNQPETGESDGGNSDAFLVKLSSDGKTELYGTPLGGSQNDFAGSIVLDAAGRPYIVGETNSTQYYKCATVGPHCNDIPSYPVDNHGNADIGPSNYPTTTNAFYSNVSESIQYATTDPNSGNTGGPQDEQAFITILSADLHSFVYSSLIGGGVIGGCGNGACNTNGIAVAVNASGQAFIGGNTSSAHWPTTSGAFAATCANAGNATSQCPMTGWLAGFDPSKSGADSLLFSTYVNGSSAGLDSSGNPLYPGGDVYGLAVDSRGNVVATGDTNADNFPTTAGTVQPACVQFGDGNGNSQRCVSAYVTKLSPTGATVWSTYFGPTKQAGNGALITGNGVALDASDNVYVVGTSNLATLPLVHPITTNQPQNDDAFVIELSPAAATELMGTFLGANGNLTVDNNSLHLDSSLNAYISGSQSYCTNCTITFPTTPGAFATTGLGGSADGWVLKLITQQQSSTTALQITPNAGAPGTSISFTATITGVSGFAVPTGTVVLTSGATTLGNITLTKGTGNFTRASLAAGTYSVVATYSGDAVYAGSLTTAQTVAIQNTPTITLTATPASGSVGTSIALQATVAASSGTPTGTVYFMDGTNILGSTLISAGAASYSTSGLAVGTHIITARYGGDSNFVAVNSTPQTVTITTLAPTVALTAAPSTASVGTTVALVATVSGAGGTPTGTLKFLDGTTVLSTITLSPGGMASYSATTLAAGTHSITASYSGDSSFSPVVSSAQTVTINKITPSIALTASPSTAIVGTAIALGATVTGTGVTPTGTVTFLDGTTTLTTVTLSTGGSASYSTTSLTAGTHSITASYSGDSSFSTLTSFAQTVTVTAIAPTVTVAANPSSLMIAHGSTGTTTISVATINAFVGTLTFSCGTLPSAASCGFSSPKLIFSSSSAATQTTTLTISTSSAVIGMQQQVPGRIPPALILAALLLCPLVFSRDARRALRKRSLAVLTLMLVAILVTGELSACSGSNGPSVASTTPAGTYSVPVTVAGTPSATALNLQVVVQ